MENKTKQILSVVLPILLLSAFPAFAKGPVDHRSDKQQIPAQVKQLEDQTANLRADYLKNKTQLAENLRLQLEGLGSTTEDRVIRQRLMSQYNQDLSDLKDSFKVGMDTLNDAKFRLMQDNISGFAPRSEPSASNVPVGSPKKGKVKGKAGAKASGGTLQERIVNQDKAVREERARRRSLKSAEYNKTIESRLKQLNAQPPLQGTGPQTPGPNLTPPVGSGVKPTLNEAAKKGSSDLSQKLDLKNKASAFKDRPGFGQGKLKGFSHFPRKFKGSHKR